MRIASLALLSLVACGGGGQSPPMQDAADPPDSFDDASVCGADLFVKGELLDLDSTAADFKGVFNAQLTLQGMPATTLSTPPNGRIEICVPAARTVVFEVDGPPEYLDGTMYIETEALGGVPLSFRSYSAAQVAPLYAFDASKGHVLVFLAGDRSDLTLDRAHDPPLSGNDDGNPGTVTWTAGNGGRYVLFPNVDVANPTAMLTGDTSGPHTIPIAAGALTLVAVFFVFL